MNLPTPHILAAKGDFAKTVLMPGDPLRARFVAERYLEKARLVNDLRGVQGYTGLYHDTPVSVMASGMGMPSIAIYATELFAGYGVENIVRIGTAGAMQENVQLRDIVIAQGACTESTLQDAFGVTGHFAPIASFDLLTIVAAKAKEKNLSFHVGNVFSTDAFYRFEEGVPSALTATNRWANMGVLAVEMEAAALYLCAARQRKKALCLCTISDHLIGGDALSGKEREQTLDEMIRLALSSAEQF